jgi:hypothetical protein
MYAGKQIAVRSAVDERRDAGVSLDILEIEDVADSRERRYRKIKNGSKRVIDKLDKVYIIHVRDNITEK